MTGSPRDGSRRPPRSGRARAAIERRLITLGTSRVAGYVSALLVPIAITVAVSWLRLPPFVFEHLIVLLVVGIAVPWGLGPSVLTALVAVVADDVVFREPIGQPAITGIRDVIDLALFALVALIISGLVTRAHADRLAARDAAERERRAREDRDRLIATVSHDLATPLSVLATTVQFARRVGNVAEVDLARLLVRLETATARAISLVRTLTDAQALDSDGFALNLGVHDVRALVAPIVQMLDRVSERHPLVLAVPAGPVLVRGDADRLQRVIENLVNNAIKYSPEGGTIEVSITTEDRSVVVRVRDHGIGISAEALPHIFERSYRATEAAATAPGLGLGLSIAAHVVALHGGTISAQPGDGGGTVVTMRLPTVARDFAGAALDLAAIEKRCDV
jgi:signal transduction histidine kinase